jgi:hypothetical protein
MRTGKPGVPEEPCGSMFLPSPTTQSDRLFDLFSVRFSARNRGSHARLDIPLPAISAMGRTGGGLFPLRVRLLSGPTFHFQPKHLFPPRNGAGRIRPTFRGLAGATNRRRTRIHRLCVQRPFDGGTLDLLRGARAACRALRGIFIPAGAVGPWTATGTANGCTIARCCSSF